MSKTISNLLKAKSFFPAYYLYPTSSVSIDYNNVKKWAKDFYNQYSQKTYQTIENCPDILFLEPDKSGSYKVDQISGIYRFQETRPLDNAHKFCVLYPVDEISDVVFNKLLKILEEPHNGLVFLLFDQKKSALLETISSRVLEIRLSKEDLTIMEANLDRSEMREKFNALLGSLPSSKGTGDWNHFLNLYSESRQDEKQLLGEFTRWVAKHPHQPAAFKEKFPGLMRWMEESKRYHNPISERAYFLFQFAGAFNKSL